MADWKSLLKEKGVLVSDGAWGTELAKHGLAAGDAPELLNVDNPAAVEAVAGSYVDAGSDIILTNTFGGSGIKLEKAGLPGRTAELNGAGTALSKKAADGNALVFASIGPTGEFMQPLGTKTREDMVAVFAEQIRACADAGADGIVVETMTDLGEATAALEAARQVCGLPVVVSMTYDKGPGGYATMMGVKPDQAAAELDKAGADVIGANCGAGIDRMIEVALLLRSATDKPLWLKSNAGMPELKDGKTVYCETAGSMAGKVEKLIEAGANIIGGCCGTTPGHIAAMIAAVDQVREKAKEVSRKTLELL